VFIADNGIDTSHLSEKATDDMGYFRANSSLELSSEEVVERCRSFWGDKLVHDIYERIKYNIHFPHVDYYMNEIDRIIDPSYIPNNEDIVRCRQATIGASVTVFWRDKFWWKIIDVGGHTPERAKWGGIVKEGINAMIYFVALDDYSTNSGEESGKTKMDISKLVWEEVVNSELFGGEATLLFLNKYDLFKEQIDNDERFSEFKVAFPDYKGEQDCQPAAEYIKSEFLEKSTRVDPKDIFTHFTCAIDSEQMSVVWNALKENIFRLRIIASGMTVL